MRTVNPIQVGLVLLGVVVVLTPLRAATLVEAINAARQAQQLSLVAQEPLLDQLAAERFQVLASRDVPEHQPGDDEDLLARGVDLGIVDAALSENVAVGFTTPEQILDAWLGSVTHRKNVLDTRAVAVGIAQDTTAAGTPLTVVVFRLPVTAEADAALSWEVVLLLGAGLLLAILLPSLLARRRDTKQTD